jgi:hypothetical protein
MRAPDPNQPATTSSTWPTRPGRTSSWKSGQVTQRSTRPTSYPPSHIGQRGAVDGSITFDRRTVRIRVSEAIALKATARTQRGDGDPAKTAITAGPSEQQVMEEPMHDQREQPTKPPSGATAR